MHKSRKFFTPRRLQILALWLLLALASLIIAIVLQLFSIASIDYAGIPINIAITAILSAFTVGAIEYLRLKDQEDKDRSLNKSGSSLLDSGLENVRLYVSVLLGRELDNGVAKSKGNEDIKMAQIAYMHSRWLDWDLKDKAKQWDKSFNYVVDIPDDDPDRALDLLIFAIEEVIGLVSGYMPYLSNRQQEYILRLNQINVAAKRSATLAKMLTNSTDSNSMTSSRLNHCVYDLVNLLLTIESELADKH